MLHRVDGDLYMEQVPLRRIAEEYGTPAYIYSEAAITNAIRRSIRHSLARPIWSATP